MQDFYLRSFVAEFFLSAIFSRHDGGYVRRYGVYITTRWIRYIALRFVPCNFGRAIKLRLRFNFGIGLEFGDLDTVNSVLIWA